MPLSFCFSPVMERNQKRSKYKLTDRLLDRNGICHLKEFLSLSKTIKVGPFVRCHYLKHNNQ